MSSINSIRSGDLGLLRQPAVRLWTLCRLTAVGNPRISTADGVYGMDNESYANSSVLGLMRLDLLIITDGIRAIIQGKGL